MHQVYQIKGTGFSRIDISGTDGYTQIMKEQDVPVITFRGMNTIKNPAKKLGQQAL
jgi:hypothetical protein